ncbi:hypothetical protein TNCV_2244981 [Trichonephila clavipes]|nr:hypothetical protein TNCV_2244981 [Trichonephila clavipes]
MDVCKCIVPAWHESTLNSRRAASPLVRLVEREERWETSDPPECSPSKSGRNRAKSYCHLDEAHFWLNGYVNKQNCRIWSEANPQVYVKTPLHPEKLTVWCALWAGGILLQKRWRPQRYSQWWSV